MSFIVIHKGIVIHRSESEREIREVFLKAHAQWPDDEVLIAEVMATERDAKQVLDGMRRGK